MRERRAVNLGWCCRLPRCPGEGKGGNSHQRKREHLRVRSAAAVCASPKAGSSALQQRRQRWSRRRSSPSAVPAQQTDAVGTLEAPRAPELPLAPRPPDTGRLDSSVAVEAGPSGLGRQGGGRAGGHGHRDRYGAAEGTVLGETGTASRSQGQGCEQKVTPRTGTGSLFYSLQNHRMFEVGRDLCGSPSPTPCQSRVTYSRLLMYPLPSSLPLALLEQKGCFFGLLICLFFTGTDPRQHQALTIKPTSTAERLLSGNQPGQANAPSLWLSLGLHACLKKRGWPAVSLAIASA